MSRKSSVVGWGSPWLYVLCAMAALWALVGIATISSDWSPFGIAVGLAAIGAASALLLPLRSFRIRFDNQGIFEGSRLAIRWADVSTMKLEAHNEIASLNTVAPVLYLHSGSRCELSELSGVLIRGTNRRVVRQAKRLCRAGKVQLESTVQFPIAAPRRRLDEP